MTDPVEIEMGGFYTCEAAGQKPVRIWIGAVELPDDLGADGLGNDPHEPVVCLVVTAPVPERPVLIHGAFWESAALDGVTGGAEPFKINTELFTRRHTEWRQDYAKDKGRPWADTPNQVYAAMIADLIRETRT